MDFIEAMNYIENKNKLGQRPGLECIKELLRRLDNPQNKIKCLHIAGTNGKGSIFTFVQSVLIEAGYKIGRYISPTIFTYLERFQINSDYIDKDTFAGLVTKVAKVEQEMIEAGFLEPTAFETETAIAFLLYVEQKVDFALIECGMGGLLDGTNVIEAPYATVMAHISMDHMQFLGDTLEKIAENKAGIIKQNGLCVSTAQDDRVREVLANTCEQKNTRLLEVANTDVEVILSSVEGSHFIYKGEEYAISLAGEYQIMNAATAILLLENIEGVKKEHIKAGLMKTSWSGRFTIVSKKPYVIVDGAHNEQAWICLSKSLHKYFTNKEFIYIIGVLRDKEYNKMVDILSPSMKYAVTVTPDNTRALDKEILAELIAKRGVLVDTANSNEEAIKLAKLKAGAEDVLVVCGSLSFIAYFLKNNDI